jgi:uncharacterized membrane protein YbhN (UPF0104 family)
MGLGLLLSAGAILLAMRQVDLAGTGAALLQARPALLAPALVLLAGAMAVRAWRWQRLLAPPGCAGRVRFRGALAATLIGYLVNTILPGRVGELVRALLISETEGIGAGRAVGSIVVEKLLDVLTLLLFLAIAGLAGPLPDWVARGTVPVAVAAAGALLALLLLGHARRAVEAWLRRRAEPQAIVWGGRGLASFLGSGLGAIDALRRPSDLLAQVALSAALWGTSAAALYTVMGAFSLPVPVTAAVLVLAVTNLGMAIPSAPAYAGVYHLLAMETLKLFGVAPHAALSYALVMHGLSYGSFVLGGLFFLWRGRYGLGALWQRALQQARDR